MPPVPGGAHIRLSSESRTGNVADTDLWADRSSASHIERPVAISPSDSGARETRRRLRRAHPYAGCSKANYVLQAPVPGDRELKVTRSRNWAERGGLHQNQARDWFAEKIQFVCALGLI